MAWEIDPFHTLIEFSVVHLNINIVKGRFKEVHGTLHLDIQQPQNSWIKAQVNAASIDTGLPARDGHLRSADFFDTTKYPMMEFESVTIEPTGEITSKVTGNLTLHGVTRMVTFQAKYMGHIRDAETQGWRVGLYATTVIDRRHFAMSFNKQVDGVMSVGNEARLELFLEALQR